MFFILHPSEGNDEMEHIPYSMTSFVRARI